MLHGDPTQADAEKKMTIIDNAKSRHLDQVQYFTVVGETWSSETLQKCGWLNILVQSAVRMKERFNENWKIEWKKFQMQWKPVLQIRIRMTFPDTDLQHSLWTVFQIRIRIQQLINLAPKAKKIHIL